MKIDFVDGAGDFTPMMALVLYRREDHYGDFDDREIIATIHQVEAERLSQGKVVELEQLAQFFTAAGIEEQHGGTVFPKGLLGFADGAVFWFVEPQEREFYFSNPKLKKLSGCKFHMPGLVFCAKASELFVWAVLDAYPTAETRLYHAPLSNVWDSGKICMPHSAKVIASMEAIRENERLFFESTGTHVSGSKSTSYSGGHDALYLAMAENPQLRPEDWLNETGKNLREVMNESA